MAKNTSQISSATAAYIAANEAEQSRAIVTRAPTAIDQAAALHMAGQSFATSARRPEPEQSRHLLAWRTGLSPSRRITGEAIPNYAGWCIEVPDPDEEGELSSDDQALLDAMEYLYGVTDENGIAMAVPIVIQHRGDEASSFKPRYVQYCALSYASLYVVCEDIPSNSQMKASVENRWGVAYAWPKGGKSTLQFSVFVKELVEAGYSLPLLCSFRGGITENVLAMLRTQHKVLKVVDKLRAEKNPNAPLLPFYAYDLPTVVSYQTKNLGSGAESQEVYYPTARVPMVIDLPYLAQHATPAETATIIEEDDRVSQAVAWSITASKAMLEKAEEAQSGKEAEKAEGVPF